MLTQQAPTPTKSTTGTLEQGLKYVTIRRRSGVFTVNFEQVNTGWEAISGQWSLSYLRKPKVPNFIKIALRHGCSPVNSVHFFRFSYFIFSSSESSMIELFYENT